MEGQLQQYDGEDRTTRGGGYSIAYNLFTPAGTDDLYGLYDLYDLHDLYDLDQSKDSSLW